MESPTLCPCDYGLFRETVISYSYLLDLLDAGWDSWAAVCSMPVGRVMWFKGSLTIESIERGITSFGAWLQSMVDTNVALSRIGHGYDLGCFYLLEYLEGKVQRHLQPQTGLFCASYISFYKCCWGLQRGITKPSHAIRHIMLFLNLVPSSPPRIPTIQSQCGW